MFSNERIFRKVAFLDTMIRAMASSTPSSETLPHQSQPRTWKFSFSQHTPRRFSPLLMPLTWVPCFSETGYR